MLVVTVDAVHFRLPALLGSGHDELNAHVLGLLAVQAVVLWGGGRSIARQAVAQRRLRRLPVLAWIPADPALPLALLPALGLPALLAFRYDML